MKKFIYIIVVAFTLFSCNDVLDKEPKNQYSESAVWDDLALADMFVNNIYYEIPHGFLGKIGMPMLCDEAMRVADRSASDVTNSLLTPSYLSVFKTQQLEKKFRWTHIYKQIRACNVCLQEINSKDFENEAFKTRILGETHFLRAYYYYMLTFMYGGVPIIDKTYKLSDDFLHSRNTFKECIDFIVEDCNEAADKLPLNYNPDDLGRATKGAALALKARVLLYAASDLYSTQTWTKGYTHPELVGYIDGDKRQRWQAAKDAAKAVMDLNIYDLYKKNPKDINEAIKNYGELFIAKNTCENIFIRSFTQKSMENRETYHPGLHNGPNGYHCHGSNNPIGQLVDDFFMADGTKFDWDNPEEKAAPYQNREARFYADILYDGAQWRERPADVKPLDEKGIIQTGFYEQQDGSWIGGLDTRKSSVEDWNGTGSGYYRRKAMDASYQAMFDVQESPWIFIRYAEVLLSYAEACNELGEDEEALQQINSIRARVALPPITVTGNKLKEAIRHERRIELSYEDQRYLDIRRWMIAPQVMIDATGIDIRYPYGKTTPTYTVITIQKRKWNDCSYFLPIEIDEINKNNLLIQNPLY